MKLGDRANPNAMPSAFQNDVLDPPEMAESFPGNGSIRHTPYVLALFYKKKAIRCIFT